MGTKPQYSSADCRADWRSSQPVPAELRSWTDKSHSCESEPSAKASAPTGRERYSGRSSLHMKLMPTSEPTIPDSCLAESSHVETSCWPGRYMYESTVSNDVGGSMCGPCVCGIRACPSTASGDSISACPSDSVSAVKNPAGVYCVTLKSGVCCDRHIAAGSRRRPQIGNDRSLRATVRTSTAYRASGVIAISERERGARLGLLVPLEANLAAEEAFAWEGSGRKNAAQAATATRPAALESRAGGKREEVARRHADERGCLPTPCLAGVAAAAPYSLIVSCPAVGDERSVEGRLSKAVSGGGSETEAVEAADGVGDEGRHDGRAPDGRASAIRQPADQRSGEVGCPLRQVVGREDLGPPRKPQLPVEDHAAGRQWERERRCAKQVRHRERWRYRPAPALWARDGPLAVVAHAESRSTR
eukprot:scaffold22960_cov58-Phaeocystis_antarctica.AAC.2